MHTFWCAGADTWAADCAGLGGASFRGITFGFGSDSELFLSDPELPSVQASWIIQTQNKNTHTHKVQKFNLESDSTTHCVDLESMQNQEPTKEQNVRNL